MTSPQDIPAKSLDSSPHGTPAQRRASWIHVDEANHLTPPKNDSLDSKQPNRRGSITPLPSSVPKQGPRNLVVPSWKTPVHLLDEAFSHMFDAIQDFWGHSADEEKTLTDMSLSHQSIDDRKFLGEYSIDQLKDFFNQSLAKGLKEKGYDNPVFYLDTSDPFVSRVSVSDESLLKKPVDPETGLIHHDPDDVYLLDVFVRVRHLKYYDLYSYQLVARLADGPADSYLFPDSKSDPSQLFTGLQDMSTQEGKRATEFLTKMIPEDEPLNATVLDWMAMQDPKATFSSDRPQLPGQTYPGLNIASEVMTSMAARAKQKQRDVLLNAPDHFHNAYLYGVLAPFRYLDPAYQGFFEALCKDFEPALKKMGLAAVSWAINLGYAFHQEDDKKKMLIWNHCPEQVLGVSKRMEKYFKDSEYLAIKEEVKNKYLGKFFIDWENGKKPIAIAMGKIKGQEALKDASQPLNGSQPLKNDSQPLDLSKQPLPEIQVSRVKSSQSMTSLLSTALEKSPAPPSTDKPSMT